ncbi:MAG: M20/M25/M40 family metallo-hydrolase [Imperialibacter sp.]|uniref:M28 family metallopeptidase n=1 Tax=Imperialibacter sp. TaxID=2038411 RepID=UPI0032EFD89F
MRNTLLTFLLVLSLSSCHYREESDALIVEGLPESKAEYQRTIVGHLSGKYELANKTLIKSRWSVEERAVARLYLKELIATLNIGPRENHYSSPNLNPAIDLLLKPFNGTNIYGILPATRSSEEYVILGAHYDTGKRNAPGAIDNATGIALIYSVVKELAKSEVRDRNLIVVFFDQEEEELIGSKAFAKHIKESEWNIHSIHCFDMVGWDADDDGAMEVFSASESLLDTYRTTAGAHGKPLKEIVIDPVGYDNSSTDFDAFVQGGYNVIGAGECYYFRDSTPYKDSPDDTFETVNFQYLLSCSNMIEDVIRKIVIL